MFASFQERINIEELFLKSMKLISICEFKMTKSQLGLKLPEKEECNCKNCKRVWHKKLDKITQEYAEIRLTQNSSYIRNYVRYKSIISGIRVE